MTTVRTIWGPAAGPHPKALTSATLSLNNTTNIAAAVFIAPKTGTLDRIVANISSLTGNPPPYSVLFETVSTSGLPSTSAYGSCAAQSYDFTTTGFHTITLDTPASATKGDLVAAVIRPGGTAPDGSNFVALTYAVSQHRGKVRPSRSTASTRSSDFMLGVLYDDGTVALPAIGLAFVNVQSDTDPDEIGCLFTLPFDATCVGAVVPVNVVGGVTNTVKLYDAGGTLLKSCAVDADAVVTTLNAWVDLSVFWTGQALTKGTQYRLTTITDSDSQNYAISKVVLPSVADRAWFSEGSRWQRTQRTDAGEWSDSTTELPMMGLLLSDITNVEPPTATPYVWVM